MSAPLPPLGQVAAPAPSSPASVTVPLSWLLDTADAPLRFRSLTELAEADAQGDLSTLPLSHEPAIRLAVGQPWDGTGPGGMLGVPGRRDGIETAGTIVGVRRLLEYGWSRESPPISRARRALFRLLAQDEDPAYLYELAESAREDDARVARGRLVLREASGAALARAGYEADPRLRGAASRALDRVVEAAPALLVDDAWVGEGKRRALQEELAPPSLDLLVMLSHMPVFRAEHQEAIEVLYAIISRPQPDEAMRQQIGGSALVQPQLVLGDRYPTLDAAMADLPGALLWLETMARLGLLRRNDGWRAIFDALLDQRDRVGVWRQPRSSVPSPSLDPSIWPIYPLEDGQRGDSCYTDISFRLALIARHAGHPLELE